MTFQALDSYYSDVFPSILIDRDGSYNRDFDGDGGEGIGSEEDPYIWLGDGGIEDRIPRGSKELIFIP